MSDQGKIDEIMAEIGKLKAIVGQATFDRLQREVWEKEAAKHPPVDEAGRIVRARSLRSRTRSRFLRPFAGQ